MQTAYIQYNILQIYVYYTRPYNEAPALFTFQLFPGEHLPDRLSNSYNTFTL